MTRVRHLVALSMTLALFFLPLMGWATTDEDAWGFYSYKDSRFSIRFTWDIDGIRNVWINGVQYAGPFAYNEYGTIGGTARYDVRFGKESGKEGRVLQLSLLFDDNKLKVAAGFYYETVSSNQETGRFELRLAKAMILQHRPLHRTRPGED